MNSSILSADSIAAEHWLKRYYYLRAGVSILWVTAVFTLGTHNAAAAALLLLAYPAWDAVANWLDAAQCGGLSKNRSQRLNVMVSGLVTLLLALALPSGMRTVIAVIGAWAIASGLLQLSTALRRWKHHGAQWAMVLSGAQSALAGGLFVAQSRSATAPSIVNIAGYAGVGAIYFLVSALWLSISHMRHKRQRQSALPSA